MSIPQIALAWVMIGTCLLLMLVILLQRGRGGGLAGAFGGGGGSSAFGAKTGDVFTWITVILAGLFVTLAVVANFVFEPKALASPIISELSPAPPTDAPASVPIKLPIGEGQGITGLELLTKDGQVIPIDTKVINEGGAISPPKAAEPTSDAPPVEGSTDTKPATGGDDGSGSQEKSGGDGGKDPGK